MIAISHVSKSFGENRAVNNVSLSVERGEVVGLLGANGAGKSTLFRMMTGYLIPDSGQITLCGRSLAEEAVASKTTFGYLPENAPCYSHMTVSEYLDYLLTLRKIPKKNRKGLKEKALEVCYLTEVRHKVISSLSKGYTHRVCLAQSIAHDPQIYIFDEPTDGLDPNQKREVRKLISKNAKEKAIIFSTHILEEVETMCTKVVVMRKGQIVFQGSPEDVKNQYGQANSFKILLRGGLATDNEDSITQLKSVQKVVPLQEQGQSHFRVILSSPFDTFIRELPSALDHAGSELVSLSPDESALAEGYSALTIK